MHWLHGFLYIQLPCDHYHNGPFFVGGGGGGGGVVLLLDTTICDKVCKWLGTGRLISPGTPPQEKRGKKGFDLMFSGK